jgi:hypothetical protein
MLWLLRKQRRHITLKDASGKWMDIGGAGGMMVAAGKGVVGDGDEGGGRGEGNSEGDGEDGGDGEGDDGC